jgi:hypothetical protein
VLNPSLIVIGGGVSHIGNALLAEIRSSVYQRSLPLATRHLPIVLSELDDVAGVTGASVMTAEGLLKHRARAREIHRAGKGSSGRTVSMDDKAMLERSTE